MSRTPIILSSRENKSSTNNELTLQFPTQHKSENETIALQSLSLYYSWFNITAAFNNQQFRYIWVDGTPTDVTVDPGFYSPESFNDYLHHIMKLNGHYLVDADGKDVFYLDIQTNEAYYTITITVRPVPTVLPTGWTNPASIPLNGNAPQISFLDSDFNKLLGFEKNTSYPATMGTTEEMFNSTSTPIFYPVSTVNVTCDWVNNNRFSRAPSIVATIQPEVGFLSLIQYQPPVLLDYNVIASSYNSITLRFYDQDFRPLELQDREQIQAVMLLSKKETRAENL